MLARVDLMRVLDAVEELEADDVSLVAWELCVPEAEVSDAWQQAVAAGYLTAERPDRESGLMFRALSRDGERQLERDRQLP